MSYADRESNPFQPIGSADGFMYYGDRKGWLIVDSLNHDPSALDRANFATIAARCGFTFATPPETDSRGDFPTVSDSEDVAIENYGGAAGKGQFLLARPGSNAEDIAYECHRELADYPCLDEELWSQFETDDATEAVSEALRYEWDRDTSEGDRYRVMTDGQRSAIASYFLRNIPNGDVAFYVDNWPDFRRDRGTDARASYHRDDRAILAAALREWRSDTREFARVPLSERDATRDA